MKTGVIKSSTSAIKEYLNSEEFIFDITLAGFMITFNFLFFNSIRTILDIMRENGIFRLLIILVIQIGVALNVGRNIRRIEVAFKSQVLKLLIFFWIAGFMIFVAVAPLMLFEEISLNPDKFSIIGIIAGIVAIIITLIKAYNYESKFLPVKKTEKDKKKSKKRTKQKQVNTQKKVNILNRSFITAFSFFMLLFYQKIFLVEWGWYDAQRYTVSDILLFLLAMTIWGILPYRILLALEPPVKKLNVIIGLLIIVIDLFYF